ncbi:hypothetical protein HYC85_024240 [Camellia sinensis]|uniref:Uncharacterized protein n=1 Tax=Camellia sinensis TaxID=4442 RepID=A0A7J7GBG2_CAMSI|nr:hypothetical protein HYC85_024240 [Camellia sinensis]
MDRLRRDKQLVQQNDKRREFEEVIGKKRLNRINQGPTGCFVGESSQSGEGLNLIKIEPKECEVSELEALALEMQGEQERRLWKNTESLSILGVGIKKLMWDFGKIY